MQYIHKRQNTVRVSVLIFSNFLLMNTPLNIVVTSGGTRVPIDDVRLITNISHGSTGAAIATRALEEWHRVRYIANSDTYLPYIGNPLSDAWHWLTRDPRRYENFSRSVGEWRLQLQKAETFDAYKDAVLESVRPEHHTDVIVLSAAVSDFGPKSITSGKITSDGETSIELSPLPKIRNLIRDVNKAVIIIAFKQMPENTTENELFEKA